MEILTSMDTSFLFGVTLILGVICLFYYSVARKQSSIQHKLELFLKQMEYTQQQLGFLVNEQRRANHVLAEVSGIDLPFLPPQSNNSQMAMSMSRSSMNSGNINSGNSGNSNHSMNSGSSMNAMNSSDSMGAMNSMDSDRSYFSESRMNHNQNHNHNLESSEGSIPTKLYVGNIDYAATESELGSHFARFGQVEFVNIPVNRYTGRARGFGFVTFISKESAERAIALNGSEFKGRQIQVNFAKERDLAS